MTRILLVEDNQADALLIQEALRQVAADHVVERASDGVEALEYLRGPSARPDLVLLDLNMPRKDGREVLAEIKADDDLKQIPVVVLTTSEAEQDIVKSYKLHANCYVTKPLDLDQFVTVVKSIEDFWLAIVKLPPE